MVMQSLAHIQIPSEKLCARNLSAVSHAGKTYQCHLTDKVHCATAHHSLRRSCLTGALLSTRAMCARRRGSFGPLTSRGRIPFAGTRRFGFAMMLGTCTTRSLRRCHFSTSSSKHPFAYHTSGARSSMTSKLRAAISCWKAERWDR